MAQSSSQRILQRLQHRDTRVRYQMLTSLYESSKVGAVKYLMWSAQNDPDADLRIYAGQCLQELRAQLGLREIEPAPRLRKVEAPLVTDEDILRKQRRVTQSVSATRGGSPLNTLLGLTMVVLTILWISAIFAPWFSFADVQLTNGVILGPMVARHQEIVRDAIAEESEEVLGLTVDELTLAQIATFTPHLNFVDTFLMMHEGDSPYWTLYSEQREIYMTLEREVDVRLVQRPLDDSLKQYIPLAYAMIVVQVLAVLLAGLVVGSLLNEWIFERRFDLIVPITGKTAYWLSWVGVSILMLALGGIFAGVIAPTLMQDSLRSMAFSVMPYETSTILGDGLWLFLGAAGIAGLISLLGVWRSARSSRRRRKS